MDEVVCARLAVSGQGVKRVEKNAHNSKKGGRSTHLPRSSRYDGNLGRTSGFPVRAGHAHHPRARFPYEPYSLGALTPPTWSTYARTPIQSREVQCILVDFNFEILKHESFIIACTRMRCLMPRLLPQPVSMADP